MKCTFNATHITNCKLNFANTNIYIVLFSALVEFSSSSGDAKSQTIYLCLCG